MRKLIIGSLIIGATLTGVQLFSRGEYYWKSPSENLHSTILEGSYYDIGYKAAKMSGLSYKQTMIHLLQDDFKNYLNSISSNWGVRKTVMEFIDIKNVTPMVRRIPEKEKDMLKGVAKAFNINKSTAYRSYVYIDGFMTLAIDGLWFMRLGVSQDDYNYTQTRLISGLAMCSSFTAFGDKTYDGRRIIGRNLDYTGIGVIDRGTGVYLIKPENGYKILSISPLGTPIIGITGMNEKGLTLSVHASFSKYYKFSGRIPTLSANRRVLEKAATIEEAFQVYKDYPTFVGWMIHLSDRHPETGEARSAVIELNPKGNTIVWHKNNYTVLSNHYISEEQKKNELTLYVGADYHNYDRTKRLNELMNKRVIDFHYAAEILQDSYSPYSKSYVEYSPSSIRVPDQVSSVIFDPDNLRVLVSDGPAPSANSPYYVFSFDQIERGDDPEVFDHAYTKASHAFYNYVEAYRLIKQERKLRAGIRYLEEARRLSKDNSFDLIYGAYLVKDKRFNEAHDVLFQIKDTKAYNRQQIAVLYFIRGMLLHRLEKFSDAQRQYSVAYNYGNPKKFRDLVMDYRFKALDRKKISDKTVAKKASIDIAYMDSIW